MHFIPPRHKDSVWSCRVLRYLIQTFAILKVCPTDCVDSPGSFSVASMRFKVVAVSEISWQLLDDCHVIWYRRSSFSTRRLRSCCWQADSSRQRWPNRGRSWPALNGQSPSVALTCCSCLTSNVDSLSVLFTYDMRVFFFPLCYKVYEMCFICLLTIPIFTFFFLFYLNFEDRQRTRQVWESQKNPAVFLYLPGVRIFLFFFFFTIVLCF